MLNLRDNHAIPTTNKRREMHRKSMREPDSEERPGVFTKQDFENALKKVSRSTSRKPEKEQS
jgi:hypothetical protein